MSKLVTIILSLSLSGTFLIVLLLLLRPLYKNRLSKRWQYYIWLVVIARLLLPVTMHSSPVGNLFRQIEQAGLFQTGSRQSGEPTPSAIGHNTTNQPTDNSMNHSDLETATDANADHDDSAAYNYPTQINANDSLSAPETASQDTAADNLTASEAAIENNVYTNTDAGNIPHTIATLWLVAALLLFVRKITIYQSFVKYIRAGSRPVEDITLLERFGQIMAQNQIKGSVDLCVNHLVSSPLLIGFLHPLIVLPHTNLSEDDFYYTVLHELTHYQRRDMFYKWLVQFTICLHWFNPFVHLMGYEINRLCELSCDERVIELLPENMRKSYGDTLLNAIGAGGSYRDALASVTLNESKALLKERLDAIMQYQKKSTGILIATIIITFALTCGAVSLGAYAASNSTKQNRQQENSSPTADKGLSQPEDESLPPSKDHALSQSPDKTSEGNAILVYDESTGYYTYTDTVMGYTILYQDNIYRILADGATIKDCPAEGVVGDGCVSFTLVYKDSYYSYLFDASETTDTILEEVARHCKQLVTENRMTQEQANLMADATEHITKFMVQNTQDTDSSKQDTDFNSSGAKRIINADGQFAYTQSGYFQSPYIIELGWNLPKKAQDAYVSMEIPLADNPTLPVFFDASCKHFMSDPEAVSAVSALLTRLSASVGQNDRKQPIETPFIVSMENIEDMLGDAGLDALARNYYEHENLTYFSAIFPELDAQTQQKYLEQQFTEKDMNFFVCSIGALANAGIEKDAVDHYILKSYLEDDMDFFAVLSGFLDEESRKQWMNRCRQDDNIDYLYLLSDDDWDDEDDDTDYETYEEKYLSDNLEDKGLLEEYNKSGIIAIKNDYYYSGKRVRILIDIRSDGSIENFAYNERGTDDIRIQRDDNDNITLISYLSVREADEILRGLDIDPDDSFYGYPLAENAKVSEP